MYHSKWLMQNYLEFDRDSHEEVQRGCFISITSMNGEEGAVVPIMNNIWHHALIEGVSEIDEEKFPKKADGLWWNSDYEFLPTK